MLSSLLDLFRGRISLSIAFVIVTLLAVGCAAGRWWWMGVRTQVEMVEHLRSRGILVVYEWQDEDYGTAPAPAPYGPPFLVGLLGQDAFNRVARVLRYDDNGTSVELNAKDIEAINYLSPTRELVLRNFTGGLKDLDLPRLRELTLGQCALEEDAFGSFTRCPKLERLVLNWCKLKGQAAARLGRETRLSSILCATGVTDENVWDMIDWESTLTELVFDGDVTDAGLERSTRHQSGLTHLHLMQCFQLSDSAMTHVARCTELQELTLDAPGVTPAGLGRLRGLTKLKHLRLYLSGASSEWVQAIKQLAPHLKSLDIGNHPVDRKSNPPKVIFLSREEVEELEAAGIKVGNG